MADKRVNELPALGSENFGEDDLLMVFDSTTGTTNKATISTIATVSGTKGGFTFSGGFENRQTDPAVDNRIVVDSNDVDKWIPLDLSATAQASTDAPWWPGAAPSNGIDLFGGTALPYGVSRMLDFSQAWDIDMVYEPGVNYENQTRTGTLRFDELSTGTTNLIRIDMNITPMIANTTVEVGLWFQPKLTLDGDNDGGAFPLPGSPLFFGTGTVGRTFLSRPTSTMYIASSSDQFAYALPAIKADNPIIIEPLSLLAQNLR